MIEPVISGGQSGVDQAALRAARSAGLPTGGTAPRLFLAEVEQLSLDGVTRWWKPEPCPWLAAEFGLAECPDPGTIPPDPGSLAAWDRWVATVWVPRTRANARDSDGTIWLGGTGSSGYRATARACEMFGKPFLVVPEGPGAGRILIDWVAQYRVRTANVAGNRESRSPGIGEKAERFLAGVFRRLAGGRPTG